MTNQIQEIELDKIAADDDWNCRLQILPLGVKELAESIEAHGLKQPVVVAPEEDGKFRLIMGYRRYHAHKRLVNEGKPFGKIKAIIDPDIAKDESNARVLNLTENLHRQNLNMLEEAKAIEWFVDNGYGREQIAAAVGMSYGWVQERIMVLRMPEEIQAEIALGWISSQNLKRLHTILKKKGKLATLKACRKAKELKERGETGRLVAYKSNPHKAIKPSSAQIREMRDRLFTELGPEALSENGEYGECWPWVQCATRMLAWVLGDISYSEVMGTVQGFAEGSGYEFPYSDDFQSADSNGDDIL